MLSLFGLHIDELEEMVIKFVNEQGMEEVLVGKDAFVVRQWHEPFHKYFRRCIKPCISIELFCLNTKLSVNSSKTKIICEEP